MYFNLENTSKHNHACSIFTAFQEQTYSLGIFQVHFNYICDFLVLQAKELKYDYSQKYLCLIIIPSSGYAFFIIH